MTNFIFVLQYMQKEGRFMFSIWDFAFLIAVATFAAGSWATVKFAIKPAIRLAKNKSALRRQQQLDAQLDAEQEPQFAVNNLVHTTENYDLVTSKKPSNYIRLKAEESKLGSQIEDKGKNKKADKLFRTKQQIASELKKSLNQDVNAEELQFDYVKFNNMAYDQKTFIQIYDENKAQQFCNVAERDNTQGVPFVYTISYNSTSGMQPLRLSTPSQEVFKFGRDLILSKVKEDLENFEDDDEIEKCFPVTETCRYGEQTFSKVYKTEGELYSRIISQNEMQQQF